MVLKTLSNWKIALHVSEIMMTLDFDFRLILCSLDTILFVQQYCSYHVCRHLTALHANVVFYDRKCPLKI